MAVRRWSCLWRGALPLVLVSGLATSIDAADRPADQPSGVADPLGLGERLALIDYLQHQGATVVPGTSLEDLRRAYRLANPDAATLAAQEARDALVLQLWRRFGESADPAASLDQLQARLQELERQQAAREQAERALEAADSARVAAAGPGNAAPGPGSAVATSAPGAGAGADAPPPTSPGVSAPPRPGLASMREVPGPADLGQQVRVELISEASSPILVVVCDASLRGTMETQLRGWSPAERLAAGVDGTVVFLGHSDGQHFSKGVVAERGELGGDLAAHLRHNRPYYESLAGTRAGKAIDCAAMCGCNETGADQEEQLRNGFGYRPLHRVFTAPGCLDSPNLVASALIASCVPFSSVAPYQARFERPDIVHEHNRDLHVACFGVVSEDSLQQASTMRCFVLQPQGLVEVPP